MKHYSMTAVSALALASTALSSAAVAADYLEPKCEAALALSALPQQMRAEASAYALGPDGFRKVVEGTGPFSCIVERNHPKSIIPQCVDGKGTEVILPAIMFRAQLAMEGHSPAEVQTRFQERVAAGEFQAPDSLGVNYMMSPFNYIYIQRADRITTIPPHLMHYAPYTSNADIGAEDRAFQRSLPHVNDVGVHGYFISYVEDASDPGDVQKACGDQFDTPPEA